MRHLSTTIAVYGSLSEAEADWAVVETAASTDAIDLADAALVTRGADGTVSSVNRHSHHGWGKGAVAGAVVGLLFPPAIVGAAVVGGFGGAIVARLNRSLDRGDIKDLGEAMDSGEVALVVLVAEASVETLNELLGRATTKVSRASATAEEVQESLKADAESPSGA